MVKLNEKQKKAVSEKAIEYVEELINNAFYIADVDKAKMMHELKLIAFKNKEDEEDKKEKVKYSEVLKDFIENQPQYEFSLNVEDCYICNNDELYLNEDQCNCLYNDYAKFNHKYKFAKEIIKRYKVAKENNDVQFVNIVDYFLNNEKIENYLDDFLNILFIDWNDENNEDIYDQIFDNIIEDYLEECEKK